MLRQHAHCAISEKIINDDPHVKSSVMFGRGKFQNGVLIEPTADYTFDPSDVKQLEAFRNKIWSVHRPIIHSALIDFLHHTRRPTIERVNEFAPQHSRIFKEACPSLL